MADIKLEKVRKVYADGTVAVAEIDLHVAEGDLLVLVGPSGCGKSTLLRMVAGLEQITSGTISIGGRVVNDLAPRDRDVAMVFQNYALYPHMTVEQNLAFGLRLRKTPKLEVNRRVEEAARILGIGELLGRRPRVLSGGQRQRVAMGRAIVREPRAFLMDEPLSNLDAKLRVQMRAEISRIQRSLGVTTIYVTHDQTEAMTMGDRVAVMRRGILQQLAPPQELYDNPCNLFVAGFIGSPAMNLVQAVVQRDEDGTHVQFGGHRLRVPAEALATVPKLEQYAGRQVVLGIRPEGFSDVALREAPADQTLPVSVSLRESMGAEIYVHFEVSAPPILTEEAIDARPEDPAAIPSAGSAGAETSTWIARLAPETRAREGATIELAVDARKLYFFEPESGESLRATTRPRSHLAALPERSTR